MFWVWQQKHGFTQNIELEVSDNDEGLHVLNENGQGVSPLQDPSEFLSMTSSLEPFCIGGTYMPATSKDGINILNIGFTYADGSMPTPVVDSKAQINIGCSGRDGGKLPQVLDNQEHRQDKV